MSARHAAPGAAQAPAPHGAQAHARAAGVARVAVLGASGYSGQEFVRLALGHPGIEIALLASREFAGKPAAAMLPGLDPRAFGGADVVAPDALADLLEQGAFDTLVSCLPHGAWRSLAAAVPALASGPARIVDVSSDFRHEAAYGAGESNRVLEGSPRPDPGPRDGAARETRSAPARADSRAGETAPRAGYRYGLPEAFRGSLAGASRIANPGCYPTAATLALLPAAEAGWLLGPVMVSALSGVTGAGRAATLRTSFVELEGGASIYRAGDVHPHVAEMERNLARLAGASLPVGFAPQLVPMARGILLTASAPLARPVTPEEARAAWAGRYAGEPFVRVLGEGEWPETRAVRGSNRCDVAVTTLHGGRTLLATAALDNLVKGAAGQALQNLNLMLGWPETLGLSVHGSPW